MKSETEVVLVTVLIAALHILAASAMYVESGQIDYGAPSQGETAVESTFQPVEAIDPGLEEDGSAVPVAPCPSASILDPSPRRG